MTFTVEVTDAAPVARATVVGMCRCVVRRNCPAKSVKQKWCFFKAFDSFDQLAEHHVGYSNRAYQTMQSGLCQAFALTVAA